MKPQNLFGILGLALLIGCSPAHQKTTSGNKPLPRVPDPVIIAKLQEIVEVRQQLLKVHQLRLELGKAEDDGAAEIALAAARIQLAREQGRADLVIAELRNMVTTHERCLEMAKVRAGEGLVPPEEADRVRVALLEAQVRLQREQQEAKEK